MSKVLRTVITILCIASIGLFGFAAYKVYDSGFSHSNKDSSGMQETSVPEESDTIASDAVQGTSVPEKIEDIAIDTVQQTTVHQNSSGMFTTSAGAKYTIDKESYHIYTNESGKWVQASFRLTNNGDRQLDLATAFWYATDGNNNPTKLIGGAAANPFVLDPGKSAWYCIYADKENIDDGCQITYELNHEPFFISNKRNIVYYSLSNLRLEEENGLPVAYGTIENNTNVDTSSKENTFLPSISVFLYDQKGYVIGELGWATFNLAPGTKEDFKAELVLFQRDSEKTPPFNFSSIADYEAIAYEIYEES